MKAERNIAANTLRGTLLLRMANSRTLAKDRVHHPRRLPAFISRNRYFDCQKTEGAGFKLPREAARSFKSLEFRFEIWEREAAPAELLPGIPIIYRHLLSEFTAENTGR